MGTRHLISVYKDGEPKIAQYGQWDGYPDGQGKDVLIFLRSLMDMDFRLIEFERNVAGCRFMTDEEIEKINKLPGGPFMWHPHLSRDMGAKILGFMERTPLVLIDSTDFAADSLFCEWAYVIDLDTRMFEVYKGFNQGEAIGRFANAPVEAGSEYNPVTLVKSWSFDALPTVDEFLAEFAVDEEAEAAA